MKFDLIKKELKVINMGLSSFGENLKKEETSTVNMKWAPPAAGNTKMIDLVKRYKKISNLEFKG